MKRCTCILVLAALLLTGCAVTPPQDMEAFAPTDTLPTGENLSQPEQAWSAVDLKDGCQAMAAMGQNLLLFREDGITLLQGQTLETLATAQISDIPLPDSGMLRVREDAVAYYDEASKDMVFLDSSLKETMRLQLPEDTIGTACLSDGWNEVYYCTAQAVRVLDMQTGLTRLIKQHASDWQSVTGVILGGKYLRCEEKAPEGGVRTVLLSTQNGELVDEGAFLQGLSGRQDTYYLVREESAATEIIVGTDQSQPQCLWPADYPGQVTCLPWADVAVAAVCQENGIRLDCYRVSDGARTASLWLEESGFEHCTACQDGSVVWLACGNRLYRWEPAKSLVADTAGYLYPLYTRENPDTAGLAEMKAWAERLSSQYGITLLVGEEASSVPPWDYTLETEYIPQAYYSALSTLERVLAVFPENFYTQAADKSDNRRLTVALVRGIYGAPSAETLASAGGCQYWLDGNLHIALKLGDTLEGFFYHEMGHVIDTKVLSTTSAFYEWELLNPVDFQYDNDYIANLQRPADQYLEGERWFIDTYAMSFAIEDRCRILEYAALPGNESYFTSAPMQEKLRRVCRGIRQAFDLEEAEGKFLWEQYLQA